MKIEKLVTCGVDANVREPDFRCAAHVNESIEITVQIVISVKR